MTYSWGCYGLSIVDAEGIDVGKGRLNTNAIVNIKINTGTPLINSIYVREIVLAYLFFEILPKPEIRPRNNANIKEIIVERNVILSPGSMKEKALLYSGFENIRNTI